MSRGFDIRFHGTHRYFRWLTTELKTIKLKFPFKGAACISILYVGEFLIYHETDFTITRFDESLEFLKDKLLS